MFHRILCKSATEISACDPQNLHKQTAMIHFFYDDCPIPNTCTFMKQIKENNILAFKVELSHKK